MKKIVLALAAASVLAAPVAAAPFDRNYGGNRVQQVQKIKQVQVVRGNKVVTRTRTVARANPGQHRRWNKGQRFDSRYAQNYQVIRSPRAHRLYDAPRGQRWVRSGNDAVLVGIASGIIGAVLFGALN